MRFEESLAVFCADIGSVSKGNFGWAGAFVHSEKRSLGNATEDITQLADVVAENLNHSVPVALGFECPLFVPISDDPAELTSRRGGEDNRPWSAGAGLGALGAGLTEVVWILRRIREQLSAPPVSAYLEWPLFARDGEGLFLWEAFVSGAGKGQSTSHAGDAEIAVQRFVEIIETLPSPDDANAIESDEVHSLLGAALLRTGWTTDLAILSKRCIVIKA